MIVTCANCQTKFNLPDGKIPEGGAKVKCSRCSHVFKVEPPAAVTLEDEVENLLEEESQAPDTSAGDEFDETFDEVAAAERAAVEEPAEEPVEDDVAESAGTPEPEAEAEEVVPPAEDDLGDLFDEDEDEVGGEPAEAPEEDFAGGVDEPADEDMPGVDDLFDDSEEEPEPAADEEAASGVDDLFGDDEADDEEGVLSDEDSAVGADDDIFEDDDVDEVPAESPDDAGEVEDIFEEEEADTPEEEDLFESDEPVGDDIFDETEDEDEEEGTFGGETDFGLDQEPVKEKPGKAVPILIVLLVLVLGIGTAVYFKAWTLVGLDTESLKNIPYIGSMFMEETGGGESAAPGESPAERVRKIELQNVKQYYVANEKVGNLFVVEGKAVNRFEEPKERIKVEVVLYDAGGNVLTSQSLMCGNQLSQFQLQVQTRNEMEEALSSEVGILSNNVFIRPGGSVPFMAVFFESTEGVAEFLVKVVDVADPE